MSVARRGRGRPGQLVCSSPFSSPSTCPATARSALLGRKPFVREGAAVRGVGPAFDEAVGPCSADEPARGLLRQPGRRCELPSRRPSRSNRGPGRIRRMLAELAGQRPAKRSASTLLNQTPWPMKPDVHAPAGLAGLAWSQPTPAGTMRTFFRKPRLDHRACNWRTRSSSPAGMVVAVEMDAVLLPQFRSYGGDLTCLMRERSASQRRLVCVRARGVLEQ